MILDDILDVCNLLDKIDIFNNESYEKLSLLDKKVSDLYHYLENAKLNYRVCYKFCKELKNVLIERRILKRNISIYNAFSTQKQKLINGIDNRKLLLNALYTKDKSWSEPYKNKNYQSDELKNIIEN